MTLTASLAKTASKEAVYWVSRSRMRNLTGFAWVVVYIHHDTRLVRIAGVTAKPVAAWVTQQALNLSMDPADLEPADARGGDGDVHGGELSLDAPVAPSRVLLRQPEDERSCALRDARATGPGMWLGPACGDEGPVPAPQGCRLNEEAPEMLAGEQSCGSRQHRPVCQLQRRSVDLAP
jgi:hypothetical protein